jgi:pimeloyl-ACP methyl ester carboxylesterase
MGYATWRAEVIRRLDSGARVAATASGPVQYAELGDGPAALVLHGRPGGYDQGLLLARILGAHLARWVAVSRPGYLRTPLETGRTPADQADAYAALLDTLGIDRAAVVALSGGGPSALQFALRHPGRCRGLVLISTVARRKTARERPAVQKFFDSVLLRSDRLAWLLGGLLGPSAGPDREAAKPGLRALAQILELPEELRGAGRRNDIEQFERLPDAPPSGIRTPALIVHGTADRVVPIAHAEAAAGAIPGAELLRVEGGGHSFVFDRDDRATSAIAAFLSSLAGDV